MAKEIILASESQNRQILFSSLGIPFRVIASDIDEGAIEEKDPIKKVQEIARAKAHSVAEIANGLIIAADTFSIYNGRRYQKPKNLDEAKEILHELSEKEGMSVTGVCVLDTETEKEITDFRIVKIRCKKLTDEEIEYYIHNKPVTEWAAAYNPLDDLSSKIFQPVGKYPYKVAYYGIGIDIVVKALQEVGFHPDPKVFIAE